MADPIQIPTIRLFVCVRRFYQIMGIDPSQWNSKWLLNRKIAFVVYLQMQMFISTMAFGLYEAQTLFEYGCCTFVCNSEVGCTIAYILQYFENVNLFDWIGKINELIEKSKIFSSSGH